MALLAMMVYSWSEGDSQGWFQDGPQALFKGAPAHHCFGNIIYFGYGEQITCYPLGMVSRSHAILWVW